MPKTVTKVEVELQKATKTKKQKTGENRQDYLNNLLEAASELDDDAWSDLSPEAQAWYNAAAKARKADKKLPEFKAARTAEADEEPEQDAAEDAAESENAESEGEDQEDQPDEAEAEEEEPVARKAKKTAAKTAAAKGNGTGRRAGTGTGAPSVIKGLLLKKPSMSKQDVIDALKKKGVKVSDATVNTVRNEFRATIRLLQEHDMLKRNLEL